MSGGKLRPYLRYLQGEGRCAKCGRRLGQSEMASGYCKLHEIKPDERIMKRTGAKRCIVCGRILQGRYAYRCRGCMALQNKQAIDIRKRRAYAHQCITCGADLPDECRFASCDSCREKAREYARRSYRRRKAEMEEQTK